MAKYIAIVVRNEMEIFHAEHLTDVQMRQLNPLIRNAIYTALVSMESASDGDRCSRLFVEFNQMTVPPYWEEPELTDDYRYCREAMAPVFDVTS